MHDIAVIQTRGSTASATTKASDGLPSSITHSATSRGSKSASIAAGNKRKNDERDQKSMSPDNVQKSTLEVGTSSQPRKRRRLVVELTSPGVSITSKAYQKETDTNRHRVKPRPEKSRLYSKSSQDKLFGSQPTILSPVSVRSVDVTYNSTRLAEGFEGPIREGSAASFVQLFRNGKISGSKKLKYYEPSTNRRVQPKDRKDRISYSSPPSETSRSSSSVPNSPFLLPKPRARAPLKSSRPLAPPSPLSSPHSTSISPKSMKRESINGNKDVLTGGCDAGEQDEDSALEYADNPLPEPNAKSPSHAQARSSLHHQSSSPSTPPPLVWPVISKGKGRALEPEIVPETEVEESQESWQRNSQVARSPSKTSLVSKMKPRTPGSRRNVLAVDIIASPLPPDRSGSVSPRPQPQQRKPLRPIPQISPSKFANLPSSTVGSAEITGEGDESSIEQFDSPHRSHRPVKKPILTSQEATESSVDGSLSVPPAATDVIHKGIALAEAAKRSKQNGIFTQTKLSLASIIEKGRKRSPSIGSVEKRTTEMERGTVSPTLEFADSFLDYGDGMSGSPKCDSSRTQDATMELRQRLDAEDDWVYPGVPPDSKVPAFDGDEEAVKIITSPEIASKVNPLGD